MNPSAPLKIITLLAQALILFGAGHGGGPLVFLQLAGMLSPFGDAMNEAIDWAALIYGLVATLAQLLIVSSIYTGDLRKQRRRHRSGLCLLLIATLMICSFLSFAHGSVVLYASAIPFAVCTGISFSGKRMKRS